MKLYHSSNLSVNKPDVIHSRDYLDFGKGFYLTSIHTQAVKYGQRFIRRQKDAWLNWLDFVAKCRAGNDDSDFDLIIGGIANDRVVQTLDRYFEGELSEDETLGLLKYEKPNIQYCIRSQQMLDKCLKHIESIQL